MGKILLSMRQKNPQSLSNINDDTKFPIYQFLEQLQEPSDKYFKDGNNCFSVVEYLTTKYDKEFPCKENRFDEDVYYEGGDIHLSVKKESVRALQNAFTNRGLSDTNLKNQDYESISQTMTESRYNYLTELAEIFQKNPEDDEIIDFVTEDLPSNTWFNHTIHLPCDDIEEFERLGKKYIKYNQASNSA